MASGEEFAKKIDFSISTSYVCFFTVKRLSCEFEQFSQIYKTPCVVLCSFEDWRGWEICLETKTRNKKTTEIQADCKGNILLFIYGNMVILWTLLAAVAFLLLIFSRPFTNAMFVVIAFSHESPFSFLSQYSGEISLCHGHFSSSLVSS